MKIQGAVLTTIGQPRPYRDTTPLEVLELELEPPSNSELLVRMEIAGLCHSDLSVVDGHRVRPVPMVLGHEAAGIVEQTGAHVTDVKVGDRVVMTFLPRCNHCEGCASDGVQPCLPGSAANGVGELLDGGRRLHRGDDDIHHHLGVSAFATHAVVDRASVVRVDRDVPADVAAILGCAVLTGGGAVINSGKPVAGDSVAVVGLGGVGMAALITALALDDIDVTAIDTSPEKLRKAMDLGAREAVTPDEATRSGRRHKVVIEAAGNAKAFETAVALTAPGGRTVTVGLPAPDAAATVFPMSLVGEGRSIIGSYLGSAVPERDIPYFVDLWKRGKLPVEELITARIPLADINAALDDLADGRAIRQLIEFADTPQA